MNVGELAEQNRNVFGLRQNLLAFGIDEAALSNT